MFPTTDAQKSHLARMHQRNADGQLTEREHINTAYAKDSQQQQDEHFESGGAGLFAKPKEYVKILGALLNDGVYARTGKKILEKQSVEALWENQIPEQ